MSDTQLTRRRTLALTSGTLAIGLAGCINNTGDPNPEPSENEDENSFEIDPDTDIVLKGYATHWEGVSPAKIEGEENPTLALEDGGAYTIEAVNGDGITHDFQIHDEDGVIVDEVATEDLSSEGDSASVTFTAGASMVEYVCSYHPSQEGDLQIQ